MAISTTTFEERLERINKRQNEVGRRAKQRRSFRTRLFTFPFMVGFGILTGGTAYAWAATQPDLSIALSDMQWVLALAG